jgi:hypothetical protein
MADRRVYAITSFIFGMDGDRVGAADKVLDAVRTWPPGLPVYGLLTPYPGTPLYDKLASAGRLTRPRHWMDFAPFHMAHTPAGMDIETAHAEVAHAWRESYDASAIAGAIERLRDKPFPDRIIHLFARLAFRGIYFPQMSWTEWAGVALDCSLELPTIADRQW